MQLLLSKKRHKMYLCLWRSDKTETTMISERTETNQMSPTSPAACLEWVSRPQHSCGGESRVKEGGWSPSEKKMVPLRSSRPPEMSLGATGTRCTKAKSGDVWRAVFTQGGTNALGNSQSQEENQQKGAGRMQKGVSLVTGKISPRLRLTRFYPAKLKQQTLEGSVSSNTWQTKPLKDIL